MTKTRRLIVLGTVAVASFSFAPFAYAGGEPPPCDPKKEVCEPPPPPPCDPAKEVCEEPPSTDRSRCNAGNGNGSDAITTDPTAHCFMGDPGNSFNAGNRGGDEIPTSGGVPNPGGNDVP